MKKLIAIVDGGYGGHEQSYVAAFAQEVACLGHRVVVCCPEPDECLSEMDQSPGSDISAIPFTDRWFGRPTTGLSDFVRSRVQRWQDLSSLLQSVEQRMGRPIDGLILLSLSNYLSPLIPRACVSHWVRCPIAGLHIAPTWQSGPKARLQDLRYGILRDDWLLGSSSIRSIAVLCEQAVQPLAQQFRHARVLHCPDICHVTLPEQPSSLASRISEVRDGRHVVALIGALDHRKNVATFIETCNLSDPDKFLFVLAGKWTAASVDAAGHPRYCPSPDKLPSNMLVHFERFENEAAFNSVIQAADSIWVNYQNFFLSSNLLAKAAHFRRPVVAQNYGTIGYRASRFHLGVTVPPNDAAEVLNGLMKVAGSTLDERFGVDEQGNSLVHECSREQLRRVAGEMLWFRDGNRQPGNSVA